MRVGLLVALLAGCDVAFGLGHTEPEVTLDGYAYRKAIAITQTQSTAVDDFAVSVMLPADADLAAHAAANGRDLVFTAADGITPLDQEIVGFDPATGALDAWARVPTLSPGATTLYVYYGGPQIVPAAAATWPDLAGVWHMSELAETEHDSSGNRNHIMASSTIPAPIAGIVGGARSYNGTSDRLFGLSSPSLSFGTSSFSYSLWVDVTTSAGLYDDEPLYKGGSAGNDPGFVVELGTGPWTSTLSDDMCATTSCTPSNLVIVGLGEETLGSWVFLAVVIDRDAKTATTYRNGLAVRTTPIPTLGSVTGPSNLLIGGTPPFRGSIDEVRIHTSARPASWIQTEYANLATRDQFVVVGPETQL